MWSNQGPRTEEEGVRVTSGDGLDRIIDSLDVKVRLYRDGEVPPDHDVPQGWALSVTWRGLIVDGALVACEPV